MMDRSAGCELNFELPAVDQPNDYNGPVLWARTICSGALGRGLSLEKAFLYGIKMRAVTIMAFETNVDSLSSRPPAPATETYRHDFRTSAIQEDTRYGFSLYRRLGLRRQCLCASVKAFQARSGIS